LATTTASALHSAPAWAAACFTPSATCECFDTTPQWNVPTAAIVQQSSNGPLASMFHAIGEFRTHTMTSLANGWAIHSDAQPQADPAIAQGSISALTVCAHPIVPSTVTTPGTVITNDIFDYLFGKGSCSSVSNGGPASACQEANVPTFLMYEDIYPNSTSGYNPSTYRAGFLGLVANLTDTIAPWAIPSEWALGQPATNANTGPNTFNFFLNGEHTNYSFHSFLDGTTIPFGTPEPVQFGMVCSSTPAFLQALMFGGPSGAPTATPFGTVAPKHYPGDLLNEVGAPEALYNSSYNTCSQEVASQGFAGYSWYQWCSFWTNSDPCANAANQIMNTVTEGDPNDNSFSWWTFVGTSAFVADSITDDTIGGWTNGPTNVYGPTNGASLWANGVENQVQWNGGAGSFTCETIEPEASPGGGPNGGIDTLGWNPCDLANGNADCTQGTICQQALTAAAPDQPANIPTAYGVCVPLASACNGSCQGIDIVTRQCVTVPDGTTSSATCSGQCYPYGYETPQTPYGYQWCQQGRCECNVACYSGVSEYSTAPMPACGPGDTPVTLP
jgi:hypothetical protein